MPTLKKQSWRHNHRGVNQCFFWNETYMAGVLVLWPVDKKKLNERLRAMKLLKPESEDVKFDSHARHLWDEEAEVHVLAFSEDASTDSSGSLTATIAHEALHCANAMLHERGIASPAPTDEPLAYLLGWLVRCICEQMKVGLIRTKRK